HPIEFARIRLSLYFLSKRNQPVGFAAHRRYDHDDLVAFLSPARHATRNILDALGTAGGSATVFLYYQAHGSAANFPKALNFIAFRKKKRGAAIGPRVKEQAR